ncbi:TVP38/TMEM64 family protein [Candidatus Woesearchaeota archaeon]|nr:TVP38/TMEM64 family protein [Candidatus Woesearchaeota archaeon]
MKNQNFKKSIIVISILVLLMIVSVAFVDYIDVEFVRNYAKSFGIFSPLFFMFGMVLAVVIAPVPSLPFDLAAGAVFGGFLGGVYTVIGAVIGAVIAFWVTKRYGRKVVERFFGKEYLDVCDLCSEKYLFAVVLITRLIPFSFDFISFAAGLTKMKTWKFALATAIGTIPITFMRTYTGEVFSMQNKVVNVVLAVILISTVYLFPKYFNQKRVKKIQQRLKKRGEK